MSGAPRGKVGQWGSGATWGIYGSAPGLSAVTVRVCEWGRGGAGANAPHPTETVGRVGGAWGIFLPPTGARGKCPAPVGRRHGGINGKNGQGGEWTAPLSPRRAPPRLARRRGTLRPGFMSGAPTLSEPLDGATMAPVKHACGRAGAQTAHTPKSGSGIATGYRRDHIPHQTVNA